MDDMMQRLREVLADEESMKQIEELSQMLSPGPGEKDASAETGVGGADMGALLNMLSMSGDGKDSGSELLFALRPHLSHDRQERVDRAIRLMRLFSTLKTAKESGLLDRLI